MQPPNSPTVTLLEPWYPPAEARPFPTAGYRCSAWLFCFNPRKQVYTSHRFRALLSTGEPYSIVLPFLSGNGTFIVCEEETACQETHVWWGVPCRFVRVRMRLPVVGASIPRRFTLRALLPLEEVNDVPPFIRLGGNFLYDTAARVELESDPRQGRLIIP
jgi:hypothetical protein